MKSKQKLMLKLGAIFFSVLLILTFLSKTIDTMLLPKVDIVTAGAGSIGDRTYSRGTVAIQSVKIALPYDCTIVEALAQPGSKLAAGEPLCTFTSEDKVMRELEEQLAITGAENAVSELERQIAQGSQGDPSADQRANLQEQLHLAQLRYEKMKQEFPYNGKVIAERTEYVRTLEHEEGDTVRAGKLIADFAETDILGMIVGGSLRTVTAPFDLTITNIGYLQGSGIKKGDIVLRFTSPSITIALQEQENNINALKRSIDALRPGSGSDIGGLDAKLEEARMRLNILREKQKMGSGQVQGNQLIMPADGEVLRAAGVGDLKANRTLFELYDPLEPYEILFSVNEQSAATMEPGVSKVSLTLRGKNVETGATANTEESYPLESMSYNEETGTYDCRVVCKGSRVSMRAGTTVSVSVGAARNSYDIVLPRSCVLDDGEESHHLFILNETNGLFGKEYRVQQQEVTLLEKDSANAAVEPQGGSLQKDTKIVAVSDVPLENGMRIRLR